MSHSETGKEKMDVLYWAVILLAAIAGSIFGTIAAGWLTP